MRAEYIRETALPGQTMIVIVEDNPADVLLLRAALKIHEVNSVLYVARDGEEAIHVLEDVDKTEIPCPDLIVLDLNLPRRSGFEVLERVRASEKCGKKPVVILSSSEAAIDRAQAARLGASCYIRKPSTLKDFMSICAKLNAMLAGPVAGCFLIRQRRPTKSGSDGRQTLADSQDLPSGVPYIHAGRRAFAGRKLPYFVSSSIGLAMPLNTTTWV